MAHFDSLSSLVEKHSTYNDNLSTWLFLRKAYKGGIEFIKEALKKQPRESEDNYNLRIEEVCNFNYSQTVVNVFHQFISEKQPDIDWSDLENEDQFKWFLSNCNLKGDPFSTFFSDIEKLSSVYGHMGILVNKGKSDGIKATEIENKIYPYLIPFNPIEIYDYNIEHDYVSGQDIIEFVKLRIGKKKDKETILYYTRDFWEIYEIKNGESFICKDTGPNTLNEVPFVFHFNMKDVDDTYEGISDIYEVSQINASIVRNWSSIEEIIKYAAFPMLRKPMEEDYGFYPEEIEENEKEKETIISTSSVLEFNPTHGVAAKPDWLETAVKEPIDAILTVIEKKIEEAYRVKHISNLYSSKARTQYIKSGTAMEYDFKLLKTVLSRKVDNNALVKRKIMSLWLKWQNMTDYSDKIFIGVSKDFNIEKLIDNLDTAMGFLNGTKSKTFRKLFYRTVIPIFFPTVSEDILTEIDKDIESEPNDLGNREN